MCERVCLHLLPWEETSAAGYQGPPVRLRLAARWLTSSLNWSTVCADLNCSGKTSAERNSCLIRPSHHMPSDTERPRPVWTNECMVCEMWQHQEIFPPCWTGKIGRVFTRADRFRIEIKRHRRPVPKTIQLWPNWHTWTFFQADKCSWSASGKGTVRSGSRLADRKVPSSFR